jgi:hypothetical protein
MMTWSRPAFASVLICAASGASATGLSFTTTNIDPYLLIGQSSIVSPAVGASSQLELGAYTNIATSAPAVTAPGVSPTVGVSYDGNVAITASNGTINLQDINVYAGIGIDCAASFNVCTDSGSFFSNTNYDDAAGGSGLRPISEGDGVNGGVDMSGVLADIAAAKTAISGLGPVTQSIATSSGVINSNTTVNLASGLNIVGFSGVGSNDISLQNANLIFQGGDDAFAVVLVPDVSNFLVSQANIVIGNGGIGLNNVVFVSLKEDNDSHFNFSNSIINGVAFWDLGMSDGAIDFDNVEGCTQLVGDVITLQDVSLARCGFVSQAVVPVPPAVWLFGSALGLLGWIRRRAA